MDKPSLESVLACPRLPSLPEVAVKVLELTQRRNVELTELASVIQNDQALAVKVLRTVNSSYYGLSKPCADIRQALAYLGMNAVKSLVLGFSLAQSIDGGGDNDVSFNFVEYWRRGTYSAAAAKLLAKKLRSCDPDEAFLAALMQDIGMVALFRAMGDSYLQILDLTEGDHRRLPTIEFRSLDFDHSIVGGELARRWRLPPQLTQSISHHHHSERCDSEWSDFVRTVELACLMASALVSPNSATALQRYERKAAEWFEIDSRDAKAFLEPAANDGREISKLFNLETGVMPDVDALLTKAEKLLRSRGVGPAATTADSAVSGSNESEFSHSLHELFASCSGEAQPMGLILLAIDYGQSSETRDQLESEIERSLSREAGSHAQVRRLREHEFGVLLAKTDRIATTRLAERLRLLLTDEVTALSGAAAALCSAGAAATDPTLPSLFSSADAVFKAATGALAAARSAGGDCARVYSPRQSSEAA